MTPSVPATTVCAPAVMAMTTAAKEQANACAMTAPVASTVTNGLDQSGHVFRYEF